MRASKLLKRKRELPCSEMQPFQSKRPRQRHRQKLQQTSAQVKSNMASPKTGSNMVSETSSGQLMQDCWLALSWCQMLNQIVVVARGIDQPLRETAQSPSMYMFLLHLKTTRREVYSILIKLIKKTGASVRNAELSRFYQAITQARLEDSGDISSSVIEVLLESEGHETPMRAERMNPKLSIHDMYAMEVEEAACGLRSVENTAEITEQYAQRLRDTWRSISDLRDRVGACKLTNTNLMTPFVHEFYFWRKYFGFHIVQFEDIKDSLGRTALHFATSQLHLDHFDFKGWKRILDSSDGMLNVRDHFGRTPLHIACAADCREAPNLQLQVIQTLLRANANISIRDEYGMLAIERAVLGNREDILQVFQEVRHLDLSDIFLAMGRAQMAIDLARDLVKTKMGGTGVRYVTRECDSNGQTEASDVISRLDNSQDLLHESTSLHGEAPFFKRSGSSAGSGYGSS
ncbi:hypothetical protein F4680DRAFT_222075 [Xylaria scruposa]|nr:hypothetical protein F4680DRAFT_222075 [Xylaria scruposa]